MIELWDHGGIWARGAVSLTPQWWDAANRWGVVLAVYGNQLGVTNYKTGDWTAQDRYNALRQGRRAGIVAAGIVTWRPLPIPGEAPFTGPSYDPATGRFEFELAGGGGRMHWRLNTPGAAMPGSIAVTAGARGGGWGDRSYRLRRRVVCPRPRGTRACGGSLVRSRGWVRRRCAPRDSPGPPPSATKSCPGCA